MDSIQFFPIWRKSIDVVVGCDVTVIYNDNALYVDKATGEELIIGKVLRTFEENKYARVRIYGVITYGEDEIQ